MKKWWRNLGVATKLYFVVGIMALLIGTELFTLHFAMTTLSAVRAFVGGEGLWSKAQKSAIYNLQKFVLTKDRRYFDAYTAYMQIPLGDHRARIELERSEINMKIITEGFVEGQNHPQDVEKMVNLVRHFYRVPYLAHAIERWRAGDALVFDLIELGTKIKSEVDRGSASRPEEIAILMNQISVTDLKLTQVEIEFSSTLGAASRWLERVLMILLICAVVTIEGTGLLLTVSFAKGLSKSLAELNAAAESVGVGDFSVRVPVRSSDELGRLSHALNRMTENLEKQIKGRQDAEQASEAKNLFLANMSHEIRTPLNAILGFAELLHSGDVDQEEKDAYLAIVRRTGANLTTIIDDILDIAKMEAEEIEIQLSTFSLCEMVSDLGQILHFRSDQKGVQLLFEKRGEMSEFIRCDSMRLRQILTNIIGNAIKFTSAGGIRVEYGVEGDELKFTISDSGVGIASEQVDRLFKPFSQGDNSVRKMFGGTGLGLLLSQKLARILGGDVELIDSKIGKGSVFQVRVPYLAVEGPKAKHSTTGLDIQKLRGCMVLVCEDSPDNQHLARAFLTRAGVHVDFAMNGEEGLRMVEAKRYDLILMDMQMPVMDGFTATRRLRDRGVQTPIVALTGFAMKQDQEKCFKAGCDGFLAKPFSRDDLYFCVMMFAQPMSTAA